MVQLHHALHDRPAFGPHSPPFVMDCELRDWACSFYMKMLADFGYPKYMILQTVARFELDICGQTGRKLWITIYDEVSGHGFAEEQSDLFLEAFIAEFQVPFWNLIAASKNPHRDDIEKSDRKFLCSLPACRRSICQRVTAEQMPLNIVTDSHNQVHFPADAKNTARCVCEPPVCQGFQFLGLQGGRGGP